MAYPPRNRPTVMRSYRNLSPGMDKRKGEGQAAGLGKGDCKTPKPL